MGNIDKNRTTTVITTLAFSVLALAAIIYQHSFKEVLDLETPVVDAGIENAQKLDQGVSTPVNETTMRLESEIESVANSETVISFNATFAAARKQHGPGKTFVYKSKEYSTSYAEELNNNILNISEDQEGSITTAETKDTIRTDVFSHANKLKDRISKATH